MSKLQAEIYLPLSTVSPGVPPLKPPTVVAILTPVHSKMWVTTTTNRLTNIPLEVADLPATRPGRDQSHHVPQPSHTLPI